MPRDRTTPSFATRESLDSFEAELGALLDASEPDRRSARDSRRGPAVVAGR